MDEVAGLAELRRRYPWPETCPDVARSFYDHLPDGWLGVDHIRLFQKRLGPDTRVVCELGSWVGRSATVLCQTAPDATILCIDHWKGSEEHQNRKDWKEKLPILFETFCRNMWEYRGHIIPMKTTTEEGMEELAGLGVVPELVYVDAAHDVESVCRDVRQALATFPTATLCGDDWTFPTVREGVRKAIDGATVSVRTHGDICWELV